MPGEINVYWANQVTSTAGLRLDAAYVGGNSQVSPQGVPHDAAALATFMYPSDPQNAYFVYVGLASSGSLLGSLNSFGDLTLVFEGADVGVVANYDRVELFYKAERAYVPTPGVLGITLAFGGLAMRRRERHA
jgi:hypothetical protein